MITDDFLEWEERDVKSISLFKHCIAGMYFEKVFKLILILIICILIIKKYLSIY
jgi:hypothetical protein